MEHNRKSTWFLVFLLLAAPLTLSACNTLEGAGEDLERAGEEIQESAEQ
jgi:predicted small secreted protein